MKPNKILKRLLNTPPTKGNENDITPPIQITILSGEKEVGHLELSNQDFFDLISANHKLKDVTGAKLIIDDGKKSYTFTLDVDEFVSNKTEVGKAMK